MVSQDPQQGPSRDEVRHQVERIVQSSVFGTSGVLRHLLVFFVERWVADPDRPLKEYEIATEGLGRSPEFDPRIDSTARVHVGRLRSKLAEYYIGAGKHDSLILQIPKGAHQLRATYVSSAGDAPKLTIPVEPSLPKRHTLRTSRFLGIASIIVLLSGAAAGIYLVSRQRTPLRTFWQVFLNSPREPLIIFSNPRFMGSSTTSLRYFRDGQDPPETLDDTYTGIGEVMAVHQLTQTFASFDRRLRVKRAQLLTWDEARESHLVLVGSPEQNLAATQMWPLEEFRFKLHTEEPRVGYTAVVNLRPGPGEEKYYFASTATPIRYDYAIVALVPGVNPSRRALVLAGNTTLGTQAAAEFVCNPAHIRDLMTRLGVKSGGELMPFEAVIYVQVSGGVPTDSWIQAARPRTGSRSGASGRAAPRDTH